MKYIIGAELVFDSDERTLFLRVAPDEYLELSAITARLFVEMLESTDGVDRDYLLEAVWSSHRLKPSNNNLNNHISLLRKHIASVANIEDLIITLPKKGFVVNKKYTVVAVNALALGDAGKVAVKKTDVTGASVTLWLLSMIIVALLLLLGYVVSRDFH
ncbi:winged helix-turn-helix domain-containing protein [Serratia fonticola]|uniref:winged helix-turn-helix domain-containing protein n=1 Tax=Serratia fonticola TaxID=47917 RepID=UPI000467303C|nr:winged helix-turn-helix domain-containing protein [Serratia fonticola]